MRRHYTVEQRSELVDLVATCRATIPEAAARLGVTESTAYYWVKQAGKPPRKTGKALHPVGTPKTLSIARPTFVQLVRSHDTSAMIEVRISGTEILVRRGFDAQLLRELVEALRGDAA
jgi:transposase-like protein